MLIKNVFSAEPSFVDPPKHVRTSSRRTVGKNLARSCVCARQSEQHLTSSREYIARFAVLVAGG